MLQEPSLQAVHGTKSPGTIFKLFFLNSQFGLVQRCLRYLLGFNLDCILVRECEPGEGEAWFPCPAGKWVVAGH